MSQNAETVNIGYVINATIGELGALATLQDQLHKLKELAAAGADFGVRIDATALNGIRKSVADAVSGGLGGGTGSRSGGSNVDMSDVAVQLRQVVTALQRLAGDDVPNSNLGRRRPAGRAPAASYLDQSDKAFRTATSRRDAVSFALGKYGKPKEDATDRDIAAYRARQLQSLVDANVRGADLQARTRRQLLAAYKKAEDGDLGTIRLVSEYMEKYLSDVEGALKVHLDRYNRQRQSANRHASQAMAIEGVANTVVRTATASASPALPPVRTTYTPSAPTVAPSSLFGTTSVTRAISQAAPQQRGEDPYGVRHRPELPVKRCTVCNGSGVYTRRDGTSSTCWRCGGSGDENHPNRAAAIAAGADATKIGSYEHQAAYNPIIPSSTSRQAELYREYSRLSKEVNNGVHWGYKRDEKGQVVKDAQGRWIREATPNTRTLDDWEMEQHTSRMGDISYELLLGGLPAGFGGSHKDLHNGVLMGRRDRKRLEQDELYQPIPVSGPINPEKEAPATLGSLKHNADALEASLNKLREIKLDPLVAQFETLGSVIASIRKDVIGAGLTGGVFQGKEGELAYRKLLNEERERHVVAMADLRAEAGERQRQARTAERARLLAQAHASSLEMAGDVGGEYDADVMHKRLNKRFTKLARLTARDDVLNTKIEAFQREGISTSDVLVDSRKNRAEYVSTRQRLLQDLALAAQNEPKKFGTVAVPGREEGVSAATYLGQLASANKLYQDRVAGILRLEALQAQHADLLTASVKNPVAASKLAPLSTEFDNHLTYLQEQLGIGPGAGARSAAIAELQRLQGVAKKHKTLSDEADAKAEAARNAAAKLDPLTADLRKQFGNTTNTTEEFDAKVADLRQGSAAYQAALAEAARLDTEANRARKTARASATRVDNTAKSNEQAGFISTRLSPVDITGLKASLASEGDGIKQQTDHILQLSKARLDDTSATKKQGEAWDRLATKLKDVGAYLVASGAIYGALRLARTSLSETIRFEQDMAEVQGIFISKTQTQRDQIKTGVMQAAVDFGVDRSTTAGVAKTFAQTGAGPDKTLELTRASLLAQRGAGLDSQQATEMLIAMDNITNGRVKPGDIIDRISRVEARYPVTAQDLSTVLQRVGPMAAHLQPDMRGSTDPMDMLMGMATSLISKTRVTGAAAGTSLRFMLARLSAPQVQKKLQENFGIELGSDSPDQLRDMSDILGDIAAKYKGYMANHESGKAAALLTTFAGARQANSAAALFDDWKSTMDIAKESSMAFGDSQRRLAIQMDTLEVKTQQMSSAFLNFASVMIEKSGILRALKLGADAAGGAFKAGSEHPVLGGIVTALGSYGIGSLLQKLGGTEAIQGLGFGSKFLPLVGGVIKGSAYGAAAASAVAGGYYLYNNVLTDNAKMQRDMEMYGPAEFNRDTYNQSDQGKAFANAAGKYGMTSEGFYAAVSQAAMEAEATASDKFKGVNPNTNRKLGQFLQDEFIINLSKTFPAFSEIKDKSEQAAQALELLRQSAQFGSVSYNVQQGQMSEKAQQLGEEFLSNMQKGSMSGFFRDILVHSNADTPFRIVRETPGSLRRGGTVSAGGSYSTALVTPMEMGLAYSKALGIQGGHTTASARGSDIYQALNGIQSNIRLGSVLANTLTTGGESFLHYVQRVVEGGATLGQALDALAGNMKVSTDADLEALKVQRDKGKLTKDQTEDLRKEQQYSNLVESMRSSIHTALHVDERQKAADGSAPKADSTAVGGGAAADVFMHAMRDAANKELGTLNPSSPRAQAIIKFQSDNFDPAHWERTKLNVIGAGSGINTRAFLRDRVMDTFLKYAERNTEIGLSSKYLQGTGTAFDAVRERAANDQSALQDLIKVSAQLPADAVRAQYKFNMGADATGLDYSALSADPGSMTDDASRQLLSSKFLDAAAKFEGKQSNERQVQQLRVTMLGMQEAVREWQKGKPNAVFDSLGEGGKATLNSMAGVDLTKAGNSTAVFVSAQDFFLDLFKKLATESSRVATAQQIGNQAFAANLTRQGLGVRYGFALQDQQLQQRQSLADIGSDRVQSLYLKRAGVATNLASALGTAQQEHDVELAKIRLDAKENGGIGADGSLQGDYATKAAAAAENLKTAVVEANYEAQKNLIQLLGDAHVEYVRMATEHAQTMIKGFTQPITDILSDPRKLLGSGKGGELVTQIGQFGNSKIASAFMDNLVGPEGLFAKQAEKLFGKSQFFQEASLIKQAHIDGITEGFLRATTGPTGELTPAGLAIANAVAPGSTTISAGGAAAGIGTIAAAGWGMGQMTPLSGVAPVTMRFPAGGQDNLTGNPALNYDAARVQEQARKDQKKAAIAQAVTLGSIYASSNYFGAHGVRGADGKPNNYAAEGAQTGATLGAIAGAWLPGGSVVGGAVGSFLGGLIGSRKGKPQEQNTPEYLALQKIERNTRDSVEAITNQTRSLLSPENRLLYSPSTFEVPGQQPFGGSTSTSAAGGGVTVHINIDGTGHSTEDLANQIAATIKTQLSTYGTYTDSRY